MAGHLTRTVSFTGHYRGWAMDVDVEVPVTLRFALAGATDVFRQLGGAAQRLAVELAHFKPRFMAAIPNDRLDALLYAMHDVEPDEPQDVR